MYKDSASRYKVVVTDGRFLSYSAEEKILSAAGADLVLGQCQSEEEVIQLGRDADALMVVKAPITEKVINSLQKCRVILRYGVGFDVIDVDAATRKGIMVCNVREYCAEEVAEHSLALMLALIRKIFIAQNSIKENRGSLETIKPLHRLSSLVLGIVGFGRIGRNLAQRAMALGMEVLAYDPVADAGAHPELTDLDTLLRESDVVSLHCPLTEENHG